MYDTLPEKTDWKIKGNYWNCGKPSHMKINFKETNKGKQESDEEANIFTTDNDRVYGDLCLSASVDVFGDWFEQVRRIHNHTLVKYTSERLRHNNIAITFYIA